MTTRPEANAVALWMESRGHRPCNLVRIVRTDGQVLQFTDHDRTLQFEGNTYVPAVFAGMSADRREQGLKTGDQELHGVIDGDTLTIPDLQGNLYRDATVYHVLTDWQRPWLVLARHFKQVRAVTWDESKWVAQLHGITQIIDRPAGGRFGGVATTVCPYRLGGKYCQKDIIADLKLGVKVETVHDSRMEVSLYSTSFPGSYTDDYYRDGEIEWTWAPANYAGNAVATATTLTQSPDPGWTPGEHIGRNILILSAANGAFADGTLITGNTSDTLTYSTLPLGAPGSTDYEIAEASQLAGQVSPIVYHEDATKRITLFFPTPFDIGVGERGHMRPGCNGLFSTCKIKFNNTINFGGMHLQPRPGDTLEEAQ